MAAEEVSFLYSFDVGDTGREYQNKQIHNIAGLGIANGDRPSRPFAKPMVFEPRSFIRLQIEEISGPAGTLFIVLQGYTKSLARAAFRVRHHEQSVNGQELHGLWYSARCGIL